MAAKFLLACTTTTDKKRRMTEALFTQFAALLAAALLIPSFVFLAYALNHRNMPFWWTAACAYLLIFAGAAIAALRNPLPDLLVDLGANAVIGYGYLLSLRSVRMITVSWKFEWADKLVTGLFLLALIVVVIFSNSYQTRVGLISAFIAYISVCLVFVGSSSKSQLNMFGDTAILIFGIGNAFFAMLRGASALFDGYLSFLSFGFWDQVFFIWSISAVFCFAIGLFMNGTALISAETHIKLANERLLRKSLQEALEGQRNLKKLILHELKRPLNTLTVSIDMSRKRSKGMSTDDVEHIYRLTCAANEYLRGISDYEDIHALFDNPTVEEVSVSRLIDDIENKWRIDVEGLPTVKATRTLVDLLLFDVAIGNLLENAQKYGSSRTNVAMKVELVKGSINFDVVDDGAGIPPSETEKVFQQFYKIDGVGTNAVIGCGLGLYMARRIAEVLGGTCEVVSQEPSTMRLSLPALLDKVGKNVSNS